MINIGIGTIASRVPIPGGSVAVSSIGFSGALTDFGVPNLGPNRPVLGAQH